MFNRYNVLMLLIFFWMSSSFANEGLDLAQKVYDRPNGNDLTTLGKMVLTEKGHSPRVREIVTFRLSSSNGDRYNLIRFLDPEDIAGTGLLSFNKKGEEVEQWLYLPALDRVRRISNSRKGGRFVGSELYYEDIQERVPSDDEHRVLGKQLEGGIMCTVIESIPIVSSSSVYKKRIIWVDPETYIAQRIDYFEKDEKIASKRWFLRGKKKTQGFWTLMDSLMIDLSNGNETRMLIEDANYNQKLPRKIFSSQGLADDSIESEYRR